jgi:hypothetical protein
MEVKEVLGLQNGVALQLGAPMPVIGLLIQQPILRSGDGPFETLN